MARLEFTGMSAESVKPFLRKRLTPGPGQPAWKIIPAISLAQPWATWIAMGWKTIETRRHNRLDRIIGRRIAIHASKTWDSSSLDVAGQYLTTAQIQRHGLMTSRNMYPKGELVCLATVTSGGPMDQPADAAAALCDFHGGVGYRLAHVEALPFGIQMAGTLSISYVELPELWVEQLPLPFPTNVADFEQIKNGISDLRMRLA